VVVRTARNDHGGGDTGGVLHTVQSCLPRRKWSIYLSCVAFCTQFSLVLSPMKEMVNLPFACFHIAGI